MQLTWAEELEQKGIEKGRQQGHREGRQEGRQQGMRDLLCQMIEQRFGKLPKTFRERLAQVEDTTRLRHLSQQLFEVHSLDEFHL